MVNAPGTPAALQYGFPTSPSAGVSRFATVGNAGAAPRDPVDARLITEQGNQGGAIIDSQTQFTYPGGAAWPELTNP